MRKFLLSFVLVFVLFGASYADIVYTTSTGTLGLIEVTSASSADLKGTYTKSLSNALVSAYSDYDGNRRVILVDKTNDLTTSGDSFSRFSPNDLSKALDEETKYFEGVYGTEIIRNSRNGKSLFLSSSSDIYEFDTDTFAMKNSFDCTPKSDDVASKIKDIAVLENRIFVLAETQNSGDVVIRFDGQLKRNVGAFYEWAVASGDAMKIAELDNSRVAVARKNDVALLENKKVTSLVSLVSSDNPVKDLCRDSESGFFYATQTTDSSGNYVNTISHYTGSINNFSNVVLNSTSSTLQLIRDDTYNVLGVISGTGINLYNMSDGTLINTFTSSELGGNPVSMAITNSRINTSNKKNNSGCEVSGLGMILLLMCAVSFSKRF